LRNEIATGTVGGVRHNDLIPRSPSSNPRTEFCRRPIGLFCVPPRESPFLP
jgi:hypothetical protein